MQSEQSLPAEPHARVSAPIRHTPLASQQPLEQLEGPHVPGVTVPESSVSTSRLERPQPGASAMRKSVAKTASGTKRDTK